MKYLSRCRKCWQLLQRQFNEIKICLKMLSSTTKVLWMLLSLIQSNWQVWLWKSGTKKKVVPNFYIACIPQIFATFLTMNIQKVYVWWEYNTVSCRLKARNIQKLWLYKNVLFSWHPAVARQFIHNNLHAVILGLLYRSNTESSQFLFGPYCEQKNLKLKLRSFSKYFVCRSTIQNLHLHEECSLFSGFLLSKG